AGAAARRDQSGADLAPHPDAAAAGAAPRARHVPGQPRDSEAAPRHGEHRPARVGVLLGARARSVSAVRLLRRCVHAPALALRRQRTHRGRRVSRQRRAHLSRAGRDRQREGVVNTNETKRTVRLRFLRVSVASCIAVTSVSSVPAAAQPQPPARILVMPFENVAREGRIFWLTEAAAVLLADDLNALRGQAITRAERQQAFDRLQVPPAAALTDATVIRIGQLVGAAQVVLGSLQLENDVLVVRARSIALDTGRVQVDVVDRGPLPELFSMFARIARRIALPSAKTSSEIVARHPPVAAFEDYIKGLLAETPATAIDYLESALARQPSFDRARLAMWDVYDEQGDHERALAAVEPVGTDSPLHQRARFLAGLSQVYLKKY